MKTLGLEMVDAGFEVGVGRAAPSPGSNASAERLVPPGSTPAVAVQEEGTVHFGLEAEQRRHLFPRQVSHTFWDDLSLQPSVLRAGGRAITNSELSYHFLSRLIDSLPGVASEHGSLVAALPAPFFDDGGRGEERVGILLGIFSDLELKLSALVDSACAALLDPSLPAFSHGPALVVDLTQQATVFTLLDVGQAVSRRSHARVAGAGWATLLEHARRSLGSRFLRQTSFDVAADRRAEQEFYQQTVAALDGFTSQAECSLRISSTSHERAISVTRDALLNDLRPLAETIAQAARDFLVRNGCDSAAVPVFLTARARRLCGLATALRAKGALSVTVLNPGAAACGAAILAVEHTPPADIGDVPILDSVRLADATMDPTRAVRSAFRFHRHAGSREMGPTHVVYDGVAHPLRATGVRVSAGGGQAGDVVVPLAPSGVGPCDIVVERSNGHWTADAVVHGARVKLPGGDAGIAPGDVLEIHGAPGGARLLFVRVAG